MDQLELDYITVFPYGNQNLQKAFWFDQEGFDAESMMADPESFDPKGTLWKKFIKTCKIKLNSKTNFASLFDEEAGYLIDSFRDLLKLFKLRKLRKQELILACLNKKQAAKFTQITEEYFLSQLVESDSSLNAGVHVICKDTIYEEEAEAQLKNVILTHKDVLFSIGMPDLHPGRGYPIGSSIITNEVIYPPLIGTDIGCGMSFIKTPIPSSKIKTKAIEKWAKRLRSIDTYLECDHEELANFEFKWATEENVPALKEFGKEFFNQIGTIGAGNHFCELQVFEEILDQEEFEKANFTEDSAYLLVHSGSRGYGKHVLDKFITEYQQNGVKGFEPDTPEYDQYLQEHDDACNFAKRNRACIAMRFIKELLGDSEALDEAEGEFNQEETKIDVQTDIKILDRLDCSIDIWHNYMEIEEKLIPTTQVDPLDEDWKSCDLIKQKVVIHRKGATPADKGYVVIPGSRGSYSYLVKPLEENAWLSGYSLAHGAGRKMSRSKALAKGKHTHKNIESLLKTPLENRVVCENKDLLYEEAPEAYKKVEDVVSDLEYFNLIKIIAVLKPVMTYKFKKDQRKNDK
ncbi:unnamed protein product [Moneuplotes crassus]|uniref:3'-phosphate/5'-hydroxy nucleic acid ligase n=1 Tax=Euplotes crassus TaxID=5936 RepID=A0AAD1U8M7_EUPCR|nr:unnamed protein product [Moneuplotes crassus]